MHRVIRDPLQLLLLGATEAEANLLRALLRDQPQIELRHCSDEQPLPPYADAVLRCADRRDRTHPTATTPCLWLLRQPPARAAIDELALAGIGATRLLRLLALLIDQQRAAERLTQLAQRDPLTGLAAPVQLRERIERQLQRAQRGGRQCALLHLSLDRLPALDRSSDDELLARIGAAIADCIDERQLAVRLGDREFLIAATLPTQAPQVAALAHELLRRCRLRGEHQRREWQLGVSIGIAVAPVDGNDAERLLALARAASARCRQQGGDNFCFADTEQDALAHETTQLQGELGHALLRNEIALRYQPLFDLRRRQVAALEVLLRWQHPRLGLLAPRYFLDFARSSGSIHPLGSWVMRKACEQRRQWLGDGARSLPLSFNIERRQLQHGTLLNSVQQLIDEGALEQGALGIEIDEAELARCDRAQTAQLEALSERGIRLSVDRFSGGHCTLAQLQQLPLHALKLEQRLAADDGDVEFERALRLCRALHCDAIATGVEQRRTATQLRRLDCDAIQGFVVSRPLTAEELPRWLQQMEAGTRPRASTLQSEG